MSLFRRPQRHQPEPGGPASDVAARTDAVTVTWLRDVPPHHVQQVLRLVPSSQRLRSFEEALEEQDFETGTFVVQVRQVGCWIVLVEPNGYQSSLPETCAALSAGGAAVVSVFWNVNAQMQFLLAQNGQVQRRFDPLLPDLVSEGPQLPEEDGIAFGEAADDPREAALALAARVTDAPVSREWLLEGEHPTFSTAAGW